MLSARCSYGLRATLYLASIAKDTFVATGEISDILEIPRHFLPKIFLDLTRQDLLISHRGVNGGVTLARPPGDITVREILTALGLEDPVSRCLLERPSCCTPGDCVLSDAIGRFGATFNDALAETTLAEAAARLKPLSNNHR